MGAVELGDGEQAISDGQGSDIQGSDIQGSDIQGSDVQGTQYDGAHWDYTSLTNVQRATRPISDVVDAAITGGVLTWWVYIPLGNKWQRNSPDSTCIFDATRTHVESCTTVVDFETRPSPLAGTRFPARFRAADGTLLDATIQIGLSTADKAAVRPDPSAAMFNLNGASSCDSFAYNETMEGGKKCKNPDGCRKNCDLWLYRIYLIDSAVNNGQPHAVCGNGMAIAVSGTYASDGTRTATKGKFTFSCTAGTIAKCTRWGLRPWGSAHKSCQTACDSSAGSDDGHGNTHATAAVALLPLHQSCVRAAMADYCANGDTWTREGTLVDVWDYEHTKPNTWGFVPRTDTTPSRGVFRFESTFDKFGGFWLDHNRYDEVHASPYPGDPRDLSVCVWDLVCDADNPPHCGPDRRRPTPDQDLASTLHIDSTTACTHSEFMVGKWLSDGCSDCTHRIGNELGSAYAHCTSALVQGVWTPGTWDAMCVQAAHAHCAGSQDTNWATLMASHSECVPGDPLPELATACTEKVHRSHPECNASNWTAQCVTYANDSCYGGSEVSSPTQFIGFCGTPRTPPANLP